MAQTILHIDSSARKEGSVTRDLSAEIVARLGGTIIRRDLANPVPQLSAGWLAANFTPADERDAVQTDVLSLSDTLIAELKSADTIVIGAPVYNFSVPSALKAWIDQVCRAGLTFQYTENGPQGLLAGKRAIIAIATGGMPVGAEVDYASGYIRHVMNFIGITDVEIVAADRVMADADAAIAAAKDQVSKLAA